MISYRVIDIDTYARKDHLAYFMSMQNPHLTLTTEIDVTDLKRYCKENDISFFLTFLHVVALSADMIPQFRQRIHRLDSFDIENKSILNPNTYSVAKYELREYSQSPTSHTESTSTELYCYCTLNHHKPWEQYITSATETQSKVRETSSLEEDAEIEAYYFATCIPWIHYTGVSHPTVDHYDSNPRFSWGKYDLDYHNRLMMPLTVMVHHGLVDGSHVGLFYQNIESNMQALIHGNLNYQ